MTPDTNLVSGARPLTPGPSLSQGYRASPGRPVPSQSNINLAYRSVDIAKGTHAEAALKRISTAAKGLVERFGINNCSKEESKEEAGLEALEDFADAVISQLQWHANFTDLFGKSSDRHSYQTALAGFFAGIFTVSVWNGASYYVEVFGWRFEKELLQLKRELEAMQRTESVLNNRGSPPAVTPGIGEEGKQLGEEEGEVEVEESEAVAAASGMPEVSALDDDKKDK
ncbi:uncharacterized protein UDID_19429 [Ustilago sp. UG-2017a]|nr:uncharacterized protein UDID_19429 [Ustilago sp. UG-2017a]